MRLSSALLGLALEAAPDAAAAAATVVDHVAREQRLLPAVYLARGGRLRCAALRGYWQARDGLPGRAGIMGRTYRDGDRDRRPRRQRQRATTSRPTRASWPRHASRCAPAGLTVGVLNVESREPLRDGDLEHLRECARALGARIEELGGLPSESATQRLLRHVADIAALQDADAVADALLNAALDLVPLGSALLARTTGAGGACGRRSRPARWRAVLRAAGARVDRGRGSQDGISLLHRRRARRAARGQPRRPARRRGRDAGRGRALRPRRAAGRPRAGLRRAGRHRHRRRRAARAARHPRRRVPAHRRAAWARCASAPRPTRSPASATTRPSTRRWPARTGGRPPPSSCATSTASSCSTTPTATATATACCCGLADAMSSALRRGDRLFRIGGDEFAALLAVESARAGARRRHAPARGRRWRRGWASRSPSASPSRSAGRDRRRAAGARRPRAVLGQGGRPRRRRAGQRRAAAGDAGPRLSAARAGPHGPILGRRTHGRPGTHPQLLDHRPHRPRQVDAGRPHPRDHPHGRSAADARAGARLDGPRARARDHDQGPGRARLLRRRATARPTSCSSSTRPGHVDFTYEVSRSLAACEGALLVVDASQGVEAQTLANTYLAVDAGLELIPCLNKIDLPGAEPERVAEEVSELLGEPADTIRRISGKTGEGVEDVLEELIQKVPPPVGRPRRAAARADLRLRVRPVPRRGGLHPRRRRRLSQGRGDPRDGLRAPRPRSTTSASSRPR